jgi:DHA2 family multidrug resistance protein-like MFS transporter
MSLDVVRGVPPDRAEAARATLGGAIATAQRLGGQAGAELTVTARNAFAHSLETVAAVGALMMIIIAIVAVVILRRVTPSAAAGESGLSAAA